MPQFPIQYHRKSCRANMKTEETRLFQGAALASVYGENAVYFT